MWKPTYAVGGVVVIGGGLGFGLGRGEELMWDCSCRVSSVLVSVTLLKVSASWVSMSWAWGCSTVWPPMDGHRWGVDVERCEGGGWETSFGFSPWSLELESGMKTESSGDEHWPGVCFYLCPCRWRWGKEKERGWTVSGGEFRLMVASCSTSQGHGERGLVVVGARRAVPSSFFWTGEG